jgi:hypothetical protein
MFSLSRSLARALSQRIAARLHMLACLFAGWTRSVLASRVASLQSMLADCADAAGKECEERAAASRRSAAAASSRSLWVLRVYCAYMCTYLCIDMI